MIKKIIIFILIITLIFINVLLDINISNYINCLNKCFNKNITLNNNYIAFIYSIIAIISVLILLDTILTIYNKKSEIKGINLKEKDGTYGTANWLNEKEMLSILGKNNTPGIILGKYKKDIIKLPFDSFFNKNIAVFGSSGSMKTIRIFNYKSIRIV